MFPVVFLFAAEHGKVEDMIKGDDADEIYTHS